MFLLTLLDTHKLFRQNVLSFVYFRAVVAFSLLALVFFGTGYVFRRRFTVT